ncbi:MAG: DMT family transporter [Phreatobacter sp.]|uniref:DMT family transporter n=1 Tax=Phreatobacter sp. TaxID=1966341 RepID=UPI0027329865|nr:DMT family transporter [Phreatobacter sp.]MDP2803914.1 DMT family transporter [Phreatobacter sp.]
MATSSEARRAYWLLLAMPLFFSSNLVIARAMGDAVPPFTLALLRWGVAVLILLPFTIDGLRHNAATLALHWRRIALLGFLGMWICGAGVYWALGLTTATNGTLIYTTSPVLVLLIERFIHGKPLSWLRLAGVLIAVAGVTVIVLKGDPSALARLDLNLGDLGIAAAALAWAVYSLVLRNDGLATLPTMPLFTAIAIAGVVALAPFSAAELAMVGGSPRTVWLWAGVFGLALFSAVGAFSLYQYGVKIVGPAVTSCFLYLLPVYGVGLSVLFLGEALQPHHFAGMALVLVGLVAATVPQDIVVMARQTFRRKFVVQESVPPPSSTP